jgi:hypothetical protein
MPGNNQNKGQENWVQPFKQKCLKGFFIGKEMPFASVGIAGGFSGVWVITFAGSVQVSGVSNPS